MRLPHSIKPPFRLETECVTALMWSDVRESAFSNAGVTFLMGQEPKARVAGECSRMAVKLLADGADQEFCDVFCRIYEAFFWEGMACVKTAKVATR